MGGLSLPMRGLKYGWWCTMKTGIHTKRDLHLKTGGEGWHVPMVEIWPPSPP